jgi:hypothetical protein
MQMAVEGISLDNVLNGPHLINNIKCVIVVSCQKGYAIYKY